MKETKKKEVLVNGAISPEFIAQSISKHASKKNIGAHDIFLGQVRADEINGKQVAGINYSSYKEMAENTFHIIRESAFHKFDLICMHIHHSYGLVKAGEICLFVFVSSKHRKVAFEACQWIVEEIKTKVPIWGQEIFDDNSFQWKENLKN